MRRVLSYGLAPDGEFRRSNLETAPATVDHTRLLLIPADFSSGRSSQQFVHTCRWRLERRGVAIGVVCTRSGATASLDNSALGSIARARCVMNAARGPPLLYSPDAVEQDETHQYAQRRHRCCTTHVSGVGTSGMRNERGKRRPPRFFGRGRDCAGELLGAMLAVGTGHVKMRYQTGPLREGNRLKCVLQVTLPRRRKPALTC